MATNHRMDVNCTNIPIIAHINAWGALYEGERAYGCTETRNTHPVADYKRDKGQGNAATPAVVLSFLDRRFRSVLAYPFLSSPYPFRYLSVCVLISGESGTDFPCL